MTQLTPFEHFDLHVLRRLAKGPEWSQRFPKMKPVLDRLALNSLVKRVAPPGGKGGNQLEITDKGRTRLAALLAKEAA